MGLSRTYRWWWIAWLAGFGIIEVLAFLDPRPGDTLSEYVWWIVAHPVGAWSLACFFAWLLYHFFRRARW